MRPSTLTVMRSYGFQISSYHYFRRWIVHGFCMHTRHSMHAHVMDCACILSLLLAKKKLKSTRGKKCKQLASASYVMLICRKLWPTFKSRIQSNIHVQEASRSPSTSHQPEVHRPPSTPGIENAPFSLHFQQV